jgi:hypothetical protein
MENISVPSKVTFRPNRLPVKTSPYFPFAFLLIVFIYFASLTATAFILRPAFSNFKKYELAPLPTAGSWVLASTVSNVKFYYMISPCGGKNAIFLKFENKNKYDVNLTWVESFQTQQLGYVNGFDGVRQLQINASETRSASSCTDSKKECIRFAHQVSPAYLAEVLNFAFKDITVTKVN